MPIARVMTPADIEKVFREKVHFGGPIRTGKWHSAFQTNNPREDPEWHEETMQIDVGPAGEFTCQTAGAKKGQKFNWAASGMICNKEFISGNWASKNEGRDMAGTFILHKHPAGDKLLGFCLGKGDEKGAPVNYGAWVLVAEKDMIGAGKAALWELCPGIGDPQTEDVLPLDVVKGTRGYLVEIVKQANACYAKRLYDACSVMIRKLLEIMIIEVFEAKGQADAIKNDQDNFVYLSELIQVLGARHKDWNLGRKTREALKDLTNLKNLKNLGDHAAHNRRYMARKQDVDKVIPGLRVLADELITLANLGRK